MLFVLFKRHAVMYHEYSAFPGIPPVKLRPKGNGGTGQVEERGPIKSPKWPEVSLNQFCSRLDTQPHHNNRSRAQFRNSRAVPTGTSKLAFFLLRIRRSGRSCSVCLPIRTRARFQYLERAYQFGVHADHPTSIVEFTTVVGS